MTAHLCDAPCKNAWHAQKTLKITQYEHISLKTPQKIRANPKKIKKKHTPTKPLIENVANSPPLAARPVIPAGRIPGSQTRLTTQLRGVTPNLEVHWLGSVRNMRMGLLLLPTKVRATSHKSSRFRLVVTVSWTGFFLTGEDHMHVHVHG